jgi:hypothetical protein
MNQRILFALRLLVVWLVPVAAGAKLCGDNVKGQDVPCDCGDTVVSDLVLADDPVAHKVCPGNGLIVRAMDADHGVTIDLRGRTVRGSGRGTGVWIIYGGPGGARLVSTGRHARIAGFMDGVVAHGTNSLARIDDIVAQRSARDGVRVDAAGYVVDRSVARDSGRDGFSLSGSGFQITNSRSLQSKRFGYFVAGKDAVVGVPAAGNMSVGSGDAGFNLTGVGHRLTDCMASTAGKEGVRLNGMHYAIAGCVAQGNGAEGIVGMGGDWWLAGNRAVGNGRHGILVSGPHVEDGGGNSGTGNGGSRQTGVTMQCQISGAACDQ